MRKRHFILHLEAEVEEEEGGFSAVCATTHVSSCGNTEQEAIENLRDAMILYLDGIGEGVNLVWECKCLL